MDKEKKKKTKARKKQNRKLLTRNEMWFSICKKYPSLEIFTINGSYNHWGGYKSRENLFNILVNLKIHKSRHLKKSQKEKVYYELNLKALKKL